MISILLLCPLALSAYSSSFRDIFASKRHHDDLYPETAKSNATLKLIRRHIQSDNVIYRFEIDIDGKEATNEWYRIVGVPNMWVPKTVQEEPEVYVGYYNEEAAENIPPTLPRVATHITGLKADAYVKEIYIPKRIDEPIKSGDRVFIEIMNKSATCNDQRDVTKYYGNYRMSFYQAGETVLSNESPTAFKADICWFARTLQGCRQLNDDLRSIDRARCYYCETPTGPLCTSRPTELYYVPQKIIPPASAPDNWNIVKERLYNKTDVNDPKVQRIPNLRCWNFNGLAFEEFDNVAMARRPDH